MMYIDINGKTGFRHMQGTSGKTYGNLKLLTANELAAAKLDGIVDYIAPPTPGATLEQLKNSRKNYIRAAYQMMSTEDVNAMGFDWNGGWDSAMELDSAVRLAEMMSLTTVNLWDINNVKHTMSIADGKTVVETVSTAFLVQYEKKQGYMVDIDNAVDEAAVAAIIWVGLPTLEA